MNSKGINLRIPRYSWQSCSDGLAEICERNTKAEELGLEVYPIAAFIGPRPGAGLGLIRGEIRNYNGSKRQRTGISVETDMAQDSR